MPADPCASADAAAAAEDAGLPAGARPWAEAPAARLAALAGVLTDIDDTLTRDGVIERAALQALCALAESGVPVIAVTGRPAGWSEAVVRGTPVAAVVAENGGVMLRRGMGVQDTLRLDFAQPAAERAGHARRLAACVEALRREVPGAMPARDSAGRLTDIAIDHGEHTHLDAAAIAAVQAVMRAHGLSCTVSSIHVNGWIGTHSKWTAALWAVRELTGAALDPSRWLFVGDSTNDEPLFARLPLAAGVANIARFWPALRHRPAYVTTADRGQGFAEVARALLAARAG